MREEAAMTAQPKPNEPRYHHGALRAALLKAGEEELAEHGYYGFTLRGTAKRAGVSHAAPAHHFRDTKALLSALAARGFERLSEAMREAMADAAPDPVARFRASAVGYLRFGMQHPALLQLMFGPERPPDADPELQRQGNACFAVLTETLGAFAGAPVTEDTAGREMTAAAWSIVHGFTMLATAGRLRFLGEPAPADLERHLTNLVAAAFPPPQPAVQERNP
jgi:AcrR family transcriptional regulator